MTQPIPLSLQYAVSLLSLALTMEKYQVSTTNHDGRVVIQASVLDRMTWADQPKFFVRVQDLIAEMASDENIWSQTYSINGAPVYRARVSLDQERLELSAELAKQLTTLASFCKLLVVPV